MYPAGHMAWGYLTGRATSKFVKSHVNIPLLFLISAIPDVDLVYGLKHRGPTHSLLVLTLVFMPLFMLFRKFVLPYFAAVVVHVLADLITYEGVMILWPISTFWGGVMSGDSLTVVFLEWAGFILSMMLMFKNKDLWILFKPHPSNLLIFPLVAGILLPIASPEFIFPETRFSIPTTLLIQHLIYLGIFILSILIDVSRFFSTYLRRMR